MLINNFMVGADPELVFLDPPRIIRGTHYDTKGLRLAKPIFGFDHNGYVAEPHPEPDLCVRNVMKNLKVCMEGMAHAYGELKWRGGAYVAGTGNREHVTLGGHVHLDFPRPSEAQIRAFDNVHDTLVALDILPQEECGSRVRLGGYGAKGDVRMEHGHMEYRSLCSWLFSRKASMLSMTAIKVAAVDPDSMTKSLDSVQALSNWFEAYRLKDDDVRYMFERDYFGGDLTAHPDQDIKSVWRLNPEDGADAWTKPIPGKRGASLTGVDALAVAAQNAQNRLLNERMANQTGFGIGNAMHGVLGAGGTIDTIAEQAHFQELVNAQQGLAREEDLVPQPIVNTVLPRAVQVRFAEVPTAAQARLMAWGVRNGTNSRQQVEQIFLNRTNWITAHQHIRGNVSRRLALLVLGQALNA